MALIKERNLKPRRKIRILYNSKSTHGLKVRSIHTESEKGLFGDKISVYLESKGTEVFLEEDEYKIVGINTDKKWG